MISPHAFYCFFFFFNDTATTEIYTLSLHDALPIWSALEQVGYLMLGCEYKILSWSFGFQLSVFSQTCADIFECRVLRTTSIRHLDDGDRKSTRLNSSHQIISYAVFCLKKKNTLQNKGHPTHQGTVINKAIRRSPVNATEEGQRSVRLYRVDEGRSVDH